MCIKGFENMELMIIMVFKGVITSIGEEFDKNELNITTLHWLVLNYLYTNDGCTQQKLSEVLNKDKATLKRMVDTLCKKGLVWRDTNTENKRENYIYLTEYGNMQKEKVIQAYWKTEHKFSENIKREDAITTYNTIMKMAENIMDKSKFEAMKSYIELSRKTYLKKEEDQEIEK